MIEHKMQINGTTCVQACWAMLSGWTVEEVVKLVGDKGLSWAEEYDLSLKMGLRFNMCSMPSLLPYNYHIVTVPSLNVKGDSQSPDQ